MAQAAWLASSASAERRSDFGLVDRRGEQPSARLPPPSQLAARYDLPGLRNPPRDRGMPVDYAPPSSAPSLYTQTDVLPAFGSGGDVTSPSRHNGGSSSQSYPDSEASPISHTGSYDLYSNASSDAASFAGQRYRSNASSSPSLAQGYNINTDSLYSHPSFSDSVSSLQPPNSANYDMMSIGSYSSGKGSPLTPSDGVSALSGFSSAAGGMKDYGAPHAYSDLTMDRRLSSASSYQSDYRDDYGVPAPSGMGMGYPTNGGHVHPGGRIGGPQSGSGGLSQDMMHGVPSSSTHLYRSTSGLPGYEHFLQPSPHADMSLGSGVDETMARMKLQNLTTGNDLESFMRPFLDQYVRTPNRLAFGERTIIVMSSKVAQKSYGTEKRFLCPPPTAILVGNSWWSDVVRMGEEPRLCPPRVVVSISGEPVPPEAPIDWTGTSGKSFDVNDPPTGTTYLGRCVGKQLFISEVDEKKKKVEALVKVIAPSDDDVDRIIGTFPSKPIKVISKPSKKRQSAKNLELCINHGSTVSLFHRLRSQTVSTKYLCVSGSGSAFKGSDGAPLMGLDARTRTATPSFIARTSAWDPFVLYIVDVNRPSSGIDSPPPTPPQPEYPSPPPNAIPFTNNGSPIPVYYNQTVVLQCLTSGVVSPILIIRKVDHATTVVGGGVQEGAKNVNESFCVPGEVCGDPVSQLHKVAFEVYDPNKRMPEPETPGASGAFLSCMGEKVNTYRPVDGRKWAPNSAGARASDSPLQSPVVGGQSPLMTSASMTSMGDYFGAALGESMAGSPETEFPSNDGGKVKKGKRSTSSAGVVVKTPGGKSARRRPNSAGGGSTTSGRPGAGEAPSACSGALWTVDIGETSVWTIVGVDQIRYNFYVPPMLFDSQAAPQTGSFPIPTQPVTPFPSVVKYLPPDRAAEVPKIHTNRGAKPHPHAARMLTLYGENLSKTDPVSVFFGSEPSPYVEVRCSEVLGCLPPDVPQVSGKRKPIILVRRDGVVFPSNVMYP